MKAIRRLQPQRGIALLSVIVLLLVFVIFAGAVVVQMSQEVNSVHNDGVSNRALVAADAGVKATIVGIEEAMSTGGSLPGTVTYTYPEATAISTVSYSAQIVGGGWDSLPGGFQRYYLISSTGTVFDGNQNHNRTVNVVVQAQSVTTFGSASNYDTNQFGNTVWYTPNQVFDGRVYDGGPMHVEYDDTSKNPIFESSVQTPLTPFWFDTNGGSKAPPSAWGSIIAGGSSSFQIGGNPIGLPDPSTNMIVASEAFYGDSTHTSVFPSCGNKANGGVCMNSGPAESGSGTLTTGIYVNPGKGAAPTISSSSSGSTDTLTITGKFGTYNITANFATNTTSVCKGTLPCATAPASYVGVPSGESGSGSGNGAIFTDGNVNVALGSMFQGQYVVAVPDFSTSNNISIIGSGDITYSDPSKDLLGLWANNVIMNTKASNVTIDAAIIAGYPGESSTQGGFYNAFCNAATCTQGNQGTLTLDGALMENMRGALGQFFASTGSHVGYDRTIDYDPRLASHPPPFYPVTGNYEIIAWDDEGQ